MSRFKKCFLELKEKKQGAFFPFLVLGDPEPDLSFELVKVLIDSGADALELGFAFSDPIADGKTIQEADQRALRKGLNTDRNFALIEQIRAYDTEIPISLLIYFNLILQKGIAEFYQKARDSGVDAVLAADCPREEAKPLLKAARENRIDQVFTITPNTSRERLKKIVKSSSGYLYLVSLLGVTGARASLPETSLNLLKRVKTLTALPLCVGFGISKPEQVKELIKAGADGVIVGSALINLIKQNLNNPQTMLKNIRAYARNLKNATLR